MFIAPEVVLVDQRNYKEVMGEIFTKILTNTEYLGFDIETEDSERHEGLNKFMKVDEDGNKSSSRPLVFDHRRTKITGFSLYPEGYNKVWYFNMFHADVENRLPFDVVRPIFEMFKGNYLCHNAPFELTMVKSAWGIELKNVICTLQLAVTAYGDDEYNLANFYRLSTEAFAPLRTEIAKHFANYYEVSEDLTPMQGEILQKIIGKQSKSSWSYNGWIKQIAYGHGLKQAVKSWFGYQMQTFEEALAGRAHMGMLTGDNVVSYGCDDAVWAVRLYRRLLEYLHQTGSEVIPTFFKQENPMTKVYHQVNHAGIRVNYPEILTCKESEYKAVAPVLRELRSVLQEMFAKGLGFGAALNAEYAKLDTWYGKVSKGGGLSGGERTRQKIIDWVNKGNSDDDYEEVTAIDGPIASSWRAERGDQHKTGIVNLTHYMPVRVLLYDLCAVKPAIGRDKKVMSDGDTQQILLERHGEDSYIGKIIKCLKKISSIDQRMKLYISPYALLTDPETERLYPVLSCKLNTRRMAASFPNPMQLPKMGDGAYVRGFFLADKEHVIVSHDWSQIELVRVAELSGDPEMLKCYQQRPYLDLHTIAVEAVMEFEEGYCSVLKKLPEVATEHNGTQFIDNKGNKLSPQDYVKFLRRDIGKASNFNYWYSGALAAIGELLGWTADKMWEATDRYRGRFSVGEEWRVAEQAKGEARGYVTLWDGHRRTRFERTPQWMEAFMQKFDLEPENVRNFWRLVARKIYRRSGNQMVNALIQGDCATLAKRTILRMEKHFAPEIAKGWVRFMLPVHDEVLHSVHLDFVPEFLERARPIMLTHPDMFEKCLLDCSASIGLTYQPFDKNKAPYGQIELSELPKLDFVDSSFYGKGSNDLILNNILDYFQESKLYDAK